MTGDTLTEFLSRLVWLTAACVKQFLT